MNQTARQNTLRQPASYAAPAPCCPVSGGGSEFRFNICICGSPADHAACGCARLVLPLLLNGSTGFCVYDARKSLRTALLPVAPGFPALLPAAGRIDRILFFSLPPRPPGIQPATPGSVQNFTGIFAALERKPYLLHTLITSRLKIFVFPLQYLSLCGIISEEGAVTASVPPCGATPHDVRPPCGIFCPGGCPIPTFLSGLKGCKSL